ncbi:MAG: hypothetical protein ABI779_06585 [Acidobacteriota bacterium]
MSEVAFSLATRDDDAGIRRLLATSAMPGRIRMRFEREPDYFAGCPAMGAFTQVLVAKDAQRVVGVACRAVQKMFINGVAEDVGYLGQLRVDAAYRGHRLVARGFRRLRELHEDGRVRGYITTIVESNVQAEGVLVRRSRGDMPRYRFLERLYTLAIPVGRRERLSTTETQSPRGVHRDSALLRELAPARNLFPAGEPHGEIVAVDGGVAALNDQRSCKQTVVEGYDRLTALARPLYNLIGPIRLPRPGAMLNHAYVTHFCVAEEEPRTARALIEDLRSRARRQGLDHILLGFTEGDPLLPVVRTFRAVEYVSSIYTVAWDDDDDLHDRLDSRPRALDLSAL